MLPRQTVPAHATDYLASSPGAGRYGCSVPGSTGKASAPAWFLHGLFA